MSHNEQPLKNLENELNSIVKENMDFWFTLVAKGVAEDVKKLHAKDGLFDPTMMDKIMCGPEGALEYHKHFLAKKPQGESLSAIENDVVEKIGESAYIHQGKYKFIFDADETNTASADFTYIWRLNEYGDYKIEYHHSSVFPSEDQKKIIDSLKDDFKGDVSDEHYLIIDENNKLHIGRVSTETGEKVRFSQIENVNGEITNKHYSFCPQ